MKGFAVIILGAIIAGQALGIPSRMLLSDESTSEEVSEPSDYSDSVDSGTTEDESNVSDLSASKDCSDLLLKAAEDSEKLPLEVEKIVQVAIHSITKSCSDYNCVLSALAIAGEQLADRLFNNYNEWEAAINCLFNCEVDSYYYYIHKYIPTIRYLLIGDLGMVYQLFS